MTTLPSDIVVVHILRLVMINYLRTLKSLHVCSPITKIRKATQSVEIGVVWGGYKPIEDTDNIVI